MTARAALPPLVLGLHQTPRRATWSPLARELGIPWCVFLLVGAVGTRNDWDLHGVSLPERHLREEEIAALAGEGVGIGSHGLHHLDATRLRADALRAGAVGGWLVARALAAVGRAHA